ncbi:MAG: DUF2917 domain-containing protein [Burkholderiales bacterium]
MNSGKDRQSALFRRGSLMRIEAIAGNRVACLRGMVWLTQERDPLDRILCAGETFTIDRPGIVLINALAHDAVLECSEPSRCSITRPLPYRSKNALSLATEIGHIKARVEPKALRAMPAGIRHETVELEARRMRGRVVWLVIQHARRAAATIAAGAAARASALLARIGRAVARTRRANAS